MSASDSRVSDLTAGSLTPKLSDRTADVRGRQWSTHGRTRKSESAGPKPDTQAARFGQCLESARKLHAEVGVKTLVVRGEIGRRVPQPRDALRCRDVSVARSSRV